MNSLELKTFTSMDCHEAYGFHMKSRGRKLAQITLFRERYKLANTIKRPPDAQTSPSRALIADKVEELPDRNGTHTISDGLAPCHLADQAGAIKQVGREKIPS
jgi:hypothetical protein